MSPLIDINLEVMLGKPVIRGTRITVELILQKLSSGATIEELLQAHPRLSEHGIQSAIEFGTERASKPKNWSQESTELHKEAWRVLRCTWRMSAIHGETAESESCPVLQNFEMSGCSFG